MRSVRRAPHVIPTLLVALTLLLGLATTTPAALQFNGTSQCANTASALSLSGATVATVSAWIYWDSYADDNQIALEYSESYTASGNNAFIVLPNSSATSQYVVSMSEGTNTNRGKVNRSSVSAAAWHFLVFAYDRTTGTSLGDGLYVDGSAVTLTLDTGGNVADNWTNEVLNFMARSCSSSPSLFADGRMAEVAVWTRILSSGDVTELWNSGSGKAADTLSSGTPTYYWQMCSDGTATTGGINLTLVGTPTTATHPISGSGICGGTGGSIRPRGRTMSIHHLRGLAPTR